MRGKKKICCRMLVLALLFCAMGKTIVQAGGGISPYYDQTMSARAILGIDGGTAYVAGNVVGVFGKATKINGFLYLQKKSGNTWSNVYTWTDSVTDSSLTISGEKTNLGSGTYRLKLVAYVYAGSSSEEVIVYSSEETK